MIELKLIGILIIFNIAFLLDLGDYSLFAVFYIPTFLLTAWLDIRLEYLEAKVNRRRIRWW